MPEFNTPRTRLDKTRAQKKREANRKAVLKHRENMTPQQRRRYLEARRKNYRENKDKAMAEKLRRVQADEAFLDSGCPYPAQDAFHRAVRRVKEKFRAQGTKLAFLVKGVIKTSNKKTKEKLRELHVFYASPQKAPSAAPSAVPPSAAHHVLPSAAPPSTAPHVAPSAVPQSAPSPAASSAATPASAAADTLRKHISVLNKKRDKHTLKYKRNLSQAFRAQDIGLSKK